MRVGQVDKDVAVAKEHFGLTNSYNAMSPLILHKGYTREYLDDKVCSHVVDRPQAREYCALHEA